MGAVQTPVEEPKQELGFDSEISAEHLTELNQMIEVSERGLAAVKGCKTYRELNQAFDRMGNEIDALSDNLPEFLAFLNLAETLPTTDNEPADATTGHEGDE